MSLADNIIKMYRIPVTIHSTTIVYTRMIIRQIIENDSRQTYENLYYSAIRGKEWVFLENTKNAADSSSGKSGTKKNRKLGRGRGGGRGYCGIENIGNL